MSEARTLQVRNLSIEFGGVHAVDDVSFDVNPGEVFAIIGPNGAGKSTIFNLISRLYEPTAGALLGDPAVVGHPYRVFPETCNVAAVDNVVTSVYRMADHRRPNNSV